MSICLELQTTTVLSKPPTYKNRKLQYRISENKNKSSFIFGGERLIASDMEIVVYYLLRNNKVTNVVCFFLLKKRRELRYSLFEFSDNTTL